MVLRHTRILLVIIIIQHDFGLLLLRKDCSRMSATIAHDVTDTVPPHEYTLAPSVIVRSLLRGGG